MNFDPLSGLPTKKRQPTPTLGPGPAEPKSPTLGGYGGPAGARTTTTSAPGDPVPDPVADGAGGFKFTPPAPSVGDLEQMINSDPLYKQAQADIQAARVGDQASRTAARQRAFVEYGAVPDLNGALGALGLVGNDIGGDITDTIRQLANSATSNGLSTVGRLDRASNDTVNLIKNDLTARGILSSGETGYQLNRQNDFLQTAKHDALQQLIDYLAGVNNSYLTNENGRLAQLRTERAGAAGRIPADAVASDASGYFGQHPVPAGAMTTADALAALATFAPHRYDFSPVGVDTSGLADWLAGKTGAAAASGRTARHFYDDGNL